VHVAERLVRHKTEDVCAIPNSGLARLAKASNTATRLYQADLFSPLSSVRLPAKLQ
jgi:hypothetical protein